MAAWFFTGREEISALWQVRPRYLLLGGLFGAAITYTVIQGMKDLGPAKAVLLIVTAQLATAYLIEIFGCLLYTSLSCNGRIPEGHP